MRPSSLRPGGKELNAVLLVFVIVARHIDLSVGSMGAICSAVMALCQATWLPFCDRASVMKNGQRVGTVNVNDVTHDILGMIILGKKPDRLTAWGVPDTDPPPSQGEPSTRAVMSCRASCLS